MAIVFIPFVAFRFLVFIAFRLACLLPAALCLSLSI